MKYSDDQRRAFKSTAFHELTANLIELSIRLENDKDFNFDIVQDELSGSLGGYNRFVKTSIIRFEETLSNFELEKEISLANLTKYMQNATLYEEGFSDIFINQVLKKAEDENLDIHNLEKLKLELIQDLIQIQLDPLFIKEISLNP